MNKIAFYMSQYRPAEELFGAATLGFAGKKENVQDAVYNYPFRPQGTVLNGTYDEIMDRIPDGEYQAAIVLCGNAGGEDAFVERLNEKLGCPIVGGGAAMDGTRGGLIAGGGQASVMLIHDKDYEIEVQTRNIHSHVLGSCKVDFDDPRVIKAIDGTEPEVWLREQKARLGIPGSDFEHFTLSDKNGVNAHLSWNGQDIVSGRDLDTEMLVRYVKPEEVYKSVYEFYDDDENTIVFGCAGIKGITGEIPPVKSLGLYMFGEIGMVEGKAYFGNLMLSKIRLTGKQGD